jgi:hypothetical protein
MDGVLNLGQKKSFGDRSGFGTVQESSLGGF